MCETELTDWYAAPPHMVAAHWPVQLNQRSILLHFLFFFPPSSLPPTITQHPNYDYILMSVVGNIKGSNTYWGVLIVHIKSNGWESDIGLQSRDNVVLSAIQLYYIVLILPYCQVSRPARLDSSAWLANNKDVQLSRPQPRWMWVTPFVSFWHLGGSSGLALWSSTSDRIL